MYSDLRFAFRSLIKSPGFTAIALLTLALGIGVNTAMFSIVQTFLLQPAPYPQPDRLVRVYRGTSSASAGPLSPPDIADLRAQGTRFAAVAAFQWWSFSLAERGQPAERLQGIYASAEIFATVGLQPALGRAFTKEEQQPGRDQVVVLTDAFWRSRFAADPNIVGRTVRIDGAPQTIIGVMPPSFAYPMFWGRLDAIRPLSFSVPWQFERGNYWLNAIARLAPGVSIAQGRAELATIGARLAQQYPTTNAATAFDLVPLNETVMDRTGRSISWFTLGLAGFVLLIGCANLANLHLARSAARRREFAVRAALGASRFQVMRQLLIESLVLACCGGAIGLMLAGWVNDIVARQVDIGGFAGAITFSIDWPVVGYASAAALAAGLASGLVPAWLAARTDVNAALKQQSRGSTGDRTHHRLSHALIVAELAFALVLLAGAGFFIHGLRHSTNQDPGWQTSNLLLGTVTLPDTQPHDRYLSDKAHLNFYDRLVERLRTLPGVEHASLSSSVPVWAYNSSRAFLLEGAPAAPAGSEPLADNVFVTPDFLNTLGIRLVAGRDFPADIRLESPRYVLINEAMAQRFWPGANPIGKRIGNTDPNQREWSEVIGVVRDVRFVANLGANETRYQIYRPLAQEPWGYLTIAVRARDASALADSVRRVVSELDPDLPVVGLGTVEQSVAHLQHNFQVARGLLTGFAILGLILASIGLYGVVSTLVAHRTQEFGIRVALGATVRDVVWLVLGKSLWLAAIGAVLGLVGAGGLVVLLGKLLPGLGAGDPVLLAMIVLLLLVVALAACLIPARRAARVDPVIALRAD